MTSQSHYKDFVDGVVFLKVHDTSNVVLSPYSFNKPALNQLISEYNVDTILRPFKTNDTSLKRIYKAYFQDTSRVDSFVYELAMLNFIEYSEKVPLHYTSYQPDDLLSQQWNLFKINATGAWDITKGSPSVKVAVVDNAVSVNHPDLQSNIWVNPGEQNNGIDDDLNGYTDDMNGYDVADDDNNPNPPTGTSSADPFVHGTHCSGIVSSVTDNGQGIASLGFNIKVIGVKCSEDSSNGETITAAYEGVDYAISAGADIISMSFGTPTNSVTGAYVISSANSRGIVLVGAAGNADTTQMFYPAAYNDVIAVGATNPNDEKAGFSNYGNWVDVMAPGTNIYSTVPGSGAYASLSGTSMACPLVSALSGLVLSVNNTASPSQVKSFITGGCEDISSQNPNYGGMLGSGRINAYNTLQIAGYNEKSGNNALDVSVFPNPSSGRITISGQHHKSVTFKVYDRTGRTIRESRRKVSLPYSIDFEGELDKGFYFLEINDGKRSVVKKIIRI